MKQSGGFEDNYLQGGKMQVCLVLARYIFKQLSPAKKETNKQTKQAANEQTNLSTADKPCPSFPFLIFSIDSFRKGRLLKTQI